MSEYLTYPACRKMNLRGAFPDTDLVWVNNYPSSPMYVIISKEEAKRAGLNPERLIPVYKQYSINIASDSDGKRLLKMRARLIKCFELFRMYGDVAFIIQERNKQSYLYANWQHVDYDVMSAYLQGILHGIRSVREVP